MKNVVLIVFAIIAVAAVYHFTQNNSLEAPTVATDVTTTVPAEQPVAAETTQTESKPVSLVSKAPADARVFILEPSDGATVSSPVTIKFGLENMTVAKAGDNQDNSGHHHLLIDLDELPDMTAPLPATDQLIHFGGAQTETIIELAPGQHSLQLLLGNYLHVPHDQPVMSEKITINVE